jgi:hypothetical protein
MKELIKNLQSFFPSYDTILPYSKAEVSFYPFKVKDAKNLSIILQEDNKQLVLKSLIELVKSCTKDFEPTDYCLADIEYLFLLIRSKSVEENLNLLLNGKPIQVNIYDIKTRNNYVKTDVKVTPTLTLKIETPKIKDLLKLSSLSKKDILLASIKQVISNNEVYNVNTFVPSEIEEFLNNLPMSVLSNLEGIKHPELFIEIKDNEKESEVSGILSFFTLR